MPINKRKENMGDLNYAYRYRGAIILVGFLALVMASEGFAREFSGVKFADEVIIGNQPCRLVGVSMRKEFTWISIAERFACSNPVRTRNR
jgi:hypothetical protein